MARPQREPSGELCLQGSQNALRKWIREKETEAEAARTRPCRGPGCKKSALDARPETTLLTCQTKPQTAWWASRRKGACLPALQVCIRLVGF